MATPCKTLDLGGSTFLHKRFCNFCKCLGDNIETCYQCNKLAVSISVATIANTESIQPMAPISAKSKCSRSTITISIVDLQNIIVNTIQMVGNASYSSSLFVSSGMSPSSWLMDFACCNHMIPHSSLFSQLEPARHPLNIHIANGSTMFGHNIGFISTFNLSVLEVFNVPNLSYNLFSMELLPLTILGVFCRIRGWDKSLGRVPKLGICFPWTTFVFYLLLLFLLLLQLLQFPLFLPLHFGMPDLVTHLPLKYNNWLLEVC